ncbi:PLP-dependent aminotransferase family protein [Marinomonas sp. 5E14-1]|uniref:aminotransferase-like domain-containing protein n=1 Tax=Marinomonas sp. 5E14-1 TaxID=3153922 RepID=UPI00326737A5
MKISKSDFDQTCVSQPKYKALALLIEQAILAGDLPDQQKLPAQRWLADKFVITHGTVTRAYDLLEKKGLVIARLGAGTYVNFPLSEAFADNSIKEYDFASSMQPMYGQQTLVKNALNELAEDPNAVQNIMTYAAQGVQKHKTIFATWLLSKGIHIEADDMVFTQGAQQGIYTSLQILAQADDYILHESMAYPGFFRAVDACRVNPLSVPITSTGLDLDALESLCKEYKPKALYITPNMQNPTNVQYTSESLAKILALSRQYGFYIIEDDVNYCLPESWRAPLQQQAADRVFYVSSLSKYVAGGLRVAYTLVPKQWQQAFNLNLHSQCWMVSTMNVEIATRFIMKADFQENQTLLANEMRYRQAAYQKLAEKHGLEIRRGGLNVWVLLPNRINMNQFNGFCAARNIKIRTADLFCHPSSIQQAKNGLRVALGGLSTRSEFDEGLVMFEKAFIEFNQQQDIVI